MQETSGDIWDKHGNDEYICIPTNGIVNKNGCAVMGAGLAKQAADRFPNLPKYLGTNLVDSVNQVFIFPTVKLFTFPTKTHFKDKADILLIERSAINLQDMANHMFISPIYLPAVGCGLGGLEWDVVEKVLKEYLDDRFWVIIN